ncbi:MAG: gliding motility lipoprotein GldH [Salinivirgaceae bacterium]|nr:gliding motility lipoprotein GldH [Salinivirgaceae bacterium]
MRTAIKTTGLMLAFLAIMISCSDNKSIYEKNYSMHGEQWNRDSILTFEVQVTDTASPYNIWFCNRITGQYPYSNMFLFITIMAPDRSHQSDTLECVLADKRGKWMGRGFGNIWSNSIPYKQNIFFPSSGTYVFYIEQAMRIDNLPHVLDAGIKIEKVN